MGGKQKKYSYEYRTIGNNAVKIIREDEVAEVAVKKRRIQKSPDAIYLEDPKRQISTDSVNRLCTFVIAFVIIATLGICVTYLETQLNINRLNSEIDRVKTEISKVGNENNQLEQDLDSMVDLDQIYDEATTRLGMRLPGPSEVFYVSYEPVSYTTKYKQIEKKSNNVTMGQVLGHIFKVGE